MSSTPQEPSPSLLAEIEGLQIAARQIVQGALAGVHRSLRRGSSIEFSEHKLYTPGDDIRHIDWRAFAKTDRYHVKQFEDETNLNVELLIDTSASMEFQSGALPSKLDYARQLAAAFSYLALRQGDATGLVTFSADGLEQLPARATSSHLMEIMHRLAGLQPHGATAVARSMEQFAQRSRRRAVVIVLTDLFDPAPELVDAFRRLTARRHDVALFHLLDPAELEFPYENPSTFLSMEDPRRLFVHPRTLRNAYVKEMRAFLERTSRTLAEAGVDYQRVSTAENPAHVMAAFLRARERG